MNHFNLAIGIIITIMVLQLFSGFYIEPLRADDALKQCEAKGFTSYESYTGVFLSTKALAVRCKQIPVNSTGYGISIAGSLI